MAGSQADIGIRVFLDDAASAGLHAINGQLGTMGDMASRASGAFSHMSASSMATMGILLGAGGAMMLFAGAIKFSVDQASALQQSMFSVAVATHVPMDEAMKYTNVLMNLAAGSIYTTAQIADGVVQLGRAGYSIQDIMGKTADGMHGMVTAGVALGIATRSTAVEGFKLLTQAMAAYHAPASQAMHYADLLQFAFEHQRGSVADLTAAFSQVLPDATRFHVSLREVVAALDTFGPAMASSARAGTALRYMMAGLYSPTEGAKNELKALGLGAFDAGGKFHSAFYNNKGDPIDFAQAVHLLHDKLKGMNQEAQNDALHKLFSVRGGQGVSDLLQMITKLDGYLGQLKQSADNSGGAMKRWDEVMKTLGGAWAGLKSSITDLGGVIGSAFIPAMTSAATAINGIVTYIRSLASASPQATAQFLAIGAAMSGLVLVAGIVLMIITGVGTGLLIIAAVAIGVVVAIIGLTVGVMLLVNWFRQFIGSANPFAVLMRQIGAAIQAAFAPTGFFGAALRALGATIASMAASTIPIFVGAWQTVTSAFQMLRPYLPMLGQMLLVLAGIIGGVILAAIIILVAGLAGLARAFALIIPGIMLVYVGIVTIFSGLVVFFMGVWNVIAGIFTGNGARIQAGLRQMGAGVLAIFNGMLMAVLGIVMSTLGAILAFIVGFIQAVISFFQHLAGTLVGHSIIPDMMNAIRNVIINGFNAVISAVIAFVSRVISAFIQLGAQAIAAVQSAWNFIRSAFSAGVATVVAVVSSGVASVISWFSNMGSQLISTVNNAWNSAKSAFSSGVDAVVSFAASLPGRVLGALASLGSMLWNSGSNAMQQFANGLMSAIGSVTSAVNTAAGVVAGFLAHLSPAKMGPLAQDDKWMPNMMSMFASGIEQNIPLVSSAASRAAGGIASAPSTARLTASTTGGGVAGLVGGNTTIPVIIDGQVLLTVVLNRLTGQMQMNGGGRAFR